MSHHATSRRISRMIRRTIQLLKRGLQREFDRVEVRRLRSRLRQLRDQLRRTFNELNFFWERHDEDRESFDLFKLTCSNIYARVMGSVSSS